MDAKYSSVIGLGTSFVSYRSKFPSHLYMKRWFDIIFRPGCFMGGDLSIVSGSATKQTLCLAF